MLTLITGIIAVGLLFVVLNGVLWTFYSLWGLQWRDYSTGKWSVNDIQVRIVERGVKKEELKQTIRHVPEKMDIHVITTQEKLELERDDITIHHFPDTLEDTKAIGKGRIYEWARRNINTNKEYVMYLGPKNRILNFPEKIPNKDMMVASSTVRTAGSRWLYLSDVLRMNKITEERGYGIGTFPLFATSRALIIRKEVEDSITWNFPAFNIGSTFVWKAYDKGYSFRQLPTYKVQSEAPKSIKSIIKLKRKWYSGRVHDTIAHLPFPRMLLISFRSTSWSMHTFVPLFIVLGFFMEPFTAGLSVLAITFLVLQSFVGWKQTDESILTFFELIMRLPVLLVLDGIGYIYGIARPVNERSLAETGAHFNYTGPKEEKEV